ncbi:hypothetical protein BGX38DRAFT_1203423 [Terfezia claveryi]|nr:hypothetical protein BGX38DRAFT_1203423 [Terfezia claveryi]
MVECPTNLWLMRINNYVNSDRQRPAIKQLRNLRRELRKVLQNPGNMEQELRSWLLPTQTFPTRIS